MEWFVRFWPNRSFAAPKMHASGDGRQKRAGPKERYDGERLREDTFLRDPRTLSDFADKPIPSLRRTPYRSRPLSGFSRRHCTRIQFEPIKKCRRKQPGPHSVLLTMIHQAGVEETSEGTPNPLISGAVDREDIEAIEAQVRTDQT
jgi:hypothetical protein